MAELIDGLRARRSFRAAKQRFDARKQFAGIEGLGKLVIGAALQSSDAIANLTSRRQHQDGHIGTLRAEVVTHFEAVLSWHHHIEDDQVVRRSQRAVHGRYAVVHCYNRVAFPLQSI
jgi:hypothetical protein